MYRVYALQRACPIHCIWQSLLTHQHEARVKVEIVRHNDGTDHAQSLLHSSVSAVLAPRDHGTFEHVQLVGLSVDILQEMKKE